jgi:hypothetical protein
MQKARNHTQGASGLQPLIVGYPHTYPWKDIRTIARFTYICVGPYINTSLMRAKDVYSCPLLKE